MTDTEKTRHLAEKVMGFTRNWLDEWSSDTQNWRTFDPIHSISDAFECLEKWCEGNANRGYEHTRESKNFYSLPNHPHGKKHEFQLWHECNEWNEVGRDDYPARAICEALLLATGYEEEKP